MASRVFVLAAVLAHASANPASDFASLEKEFPNFRRGLAKYGRHFHHDKNRHAALLKHAHNVHHRHHASLDAELDLDADSDDKTQELPMRLPGRHPSVEKALDSMPGDLEMLKESKQAAKETRADLEASVTDTMQHMNDPMSIKHAIQKKETQLRIESGKLEVLEKDAGRLDQTHDELVQSLRRMIGPKLLLARERFGKKEAVLRKEETAARAWKEKKDRLKEAAMQLIEQKKSSYQALLEAEAETARAKKKEEAARRQFEQDRQKTAEQVQSYRYAETRYKAELQHENTAKAAANAARESVQKLFNVEHAEAEKVDQSILYRKGKLQRKINEVQAAREHNRDELNGLAQKYRDWQEKQRERTAQVMKKSQETAAASEAYQTRQQQVLDSASRKVVQEAEGAGDWDGWGSSVERVQADEDDDAL